MDKKVYQCTIMMSVAGLLLMLVTGQSALAKREPTVSVQITEVFLDCDAVPPFIEIFGHNLNIGSGPLEVTLGNFAGSLTILQTPTDTEIVVEAPSGVCEQPGDYNLIVSNGTKSGESDRWVLTVGAVGPAGPQGPPGALSNYKVVMTGDAGNPIPDGGTKELVIRCPIGKNILGGGGSVETLSPGVSVQSRPHLLNTPQIFPSRTSWSVLVLNRSGAPQNVTIKGYAVCAETDVFKPDVEVAITECLTTLTRISIDNPNPYLVTIEMQVLLGGEPLWPEVNGIDIAGESSAVLTIPHPPGDGGCELLIYDVNPIGIPGFYDSMP